MQGEYQRLADAYVRLMKDFYGDRLVSVCFFGSVLRGTVTPESDVDVLVIAERMPADVGSRVRETMPVHEALRTTSAYQELRQQGRSAFVSDIFLTRDECLAHPPILLDVTEDGFIAYDRERFLESVLGDMKRRLRELGAVRVWARRGYYWVLKPNAKPEEIVEV